MNLWVVYRHIKCQLLCNNKGNILLLTRLHVICPLLSSSKPCHPGLLRHFSPKKSIRAQLIGSVEVIDELPDDTAVTSMTIPASAPVPNPLMDSGDMSTALGQKALTPEHSRPHFLLPGSHSIDNNSTASSSIWHVTPVHGQYHSRFPGNQLALRARSDDFLTDSDLSEFPSAQQSLKRSDHFQSAFPMTRHISMTSISRTSLASRSASHWSLKSTPVGTSPGLPSSLMNSRTGASMESLLSPKVNNGAFEQRPSLRMSIAGRRSVSKFSVSESPDVPSPAALDDSVFLPPPPTEEDLLAMGIKPGRRGSLDASRSKSTTPDGRKVQHVIPTTPPPLRAHTPDRPPSATPSGHTSPPQSLTSSSAALPHRQLPAVAPSHKTAKGEGNASNVLHDKVRTKKNF